MSGREKNKCECDPAAICAKYSKLPLNTKGPNKNESGNNEKPTGDKPKDDKPEGSK